MEKQFEKITSYQFKNFLEEESQSNVFKIRNFEQEEIENIKKISFQEKFTKEKGLEIFPFIREQKERKEILNKLNEQKYQEEITSRLRVIQEESIKKGYEEGLKIARDEVSQEFEKNVKEKIELLNEILRNALKLREEIYNNQKDQILFLIKSLTKWVILRELKDDGQYLGKLLEKLFQEIQTQQNFVLQVNKKDFDKIPDVMKILEEKLGEFKNSRVVIDFDLPENGVIIDSENGIIKSTLESQFLVLDEIFGPIKENGNSKK